MTPKRTRRRPETERVTVRLETLLLGGIDAMISVGHFRDRTDAIRQAVRDMLGTRAESVHQATEQLEKLKRLAALADRSHEIQEDLLKE